MTSMLLVDFHSLKQKLFFMENNKHYTFDLYCQPKKCATNPTRRNFNSLKTFIIPL